MTICIYGEPLKLYTTSNPMRGWVKELIKLRSEDSFIIALRDKPKQYSSFFDEINSFENVSIRYLSFSRKISNLFALLGFRFYNYLNIKADICISAGNPDYFFGFNGKTINFLADLSSIRKPKTSSLKWHGRIIKKNILKFGIKNTDKLVCISEYTKKDLINYYPKFADKVEVIYNGISDLWFDDSYISDKEAKKLKSKIGNYFIWWGGISPRKNLGQLLKAYKELLKEEPFPPKILIIGKVFISDKLYERLLLELSEHIVLLPFQDLKILKGYINESIGLVFPSLFEGFGLPVIEAYAIGKPVLHSNVTSLPEIAGNLGVEVNPFSVQSIIQGFKNLVRTEPESKIELRKKYAADFTYKKVGKSMSHLINETIKH